MGLINLNKKDAAINSSVLYDKMKKRQDIIRWCNDYDIKPKYYSIDDNLIIWFDDDTLISHYCVSMFINNVISIFKNSKRYEKCIDLDELPPYIRLGNIPWAAYRDFDIPEIKSMTIPDSVVSIGPFAFENSEYLEHLTIPSSVTRIEEGAFSKCTALKEIVIPKSVTIIDEHAIYKCDSLESIYTEKENIENLKTLLEKAYSDDYVKCVKDIAERDRMNESINESLEEDRLMIEGLVDKYGKEDVIDAVGMLSETEE